MKRNYNILTEPAAEPISDAEFKQLAREASADFDAFVIPLHVAEARRQIVERTGHVAVNQTFRLTLRDFPRHCDEILIERVPLVSVQSVTYTDTAGGSQTLTEGVDFRVVTGTPGRVVLLPSVVWPASQERTDVVVDFTAGYGADATNVPPHYKLATAWRAKELYRDWPVESETTKGAIEALRWRVCYV